MKKNDKAWFGKFDLQENDKNAILQRIFKSKKDVSEKYLDDFRNLFTYREIRDFENTLSIITKVKIQKVVNSPGQWTISADSPQYLDILDGMRERILRSGESNKNFLNHLKKYIERYGEHDGFGGLKDNKITKHSLFTNPELTQKKIELNRDLWVLFHTDISDEKNMGKIQEKIQSIKSDKSVYQGKFKKTIDDLSSQIKIFCDLEKAETSSEVSSRIMKPS